MQFLHTMKKWDTFLHAKFRIGNTFKTANIPTPGEVTWYAHHNPVMRWYEGCIYSFAESLGWFNRLKNETNYIVRFLGQKTTRDLFDILLSQESPTSLGFDLGEMVLGEVRGHSGPDGPSWPRTSPRTISPRSKPPSAGLSWDSRMSHRSLIVLST